MNKIRWGISLLVGAASLMGLSVFQVQSQIAIPTSTPAQIRLASVTPPPDVTSTSIGQDSGFAISGETATPSGIVMIEPISEVNVRSSPEIAEDNRLGAIQAGERYMVVGQYFNWLQIQYELAPDQRAWVYADLVEVIGGDTTNIPTVVVNATPTPDPLTDGATQTREAILAEPGGELTVTALSRIITLPEGVVEAGNGEGFVVSNETPLPTFTYPPGVLVGVPTLEATRDIQLSSSQPASSGNVGGVAPILPILGLALFGIVGIMISLVR